MSNRIAQALRQLIAVTRPRPDQSEGGVAAMAERFQRVFSEYRETVVLTALDEWPKSSEWFPTEKELRDLLDRVAMDADYASAGAGATSKGRYHKPVGNTELFWKRVIGVRGDAYARSWLWGGVTAEFTANKVYVNCVGRNRLLTDVSDLARECGVEIVEDDDVAKLTAQYARDKGLESYQPKRRRT